MIAAHFGGITPLIAPSNVGKFVPSSVNQNSVVLYPGVVPVVVSVIFASRTSRSMKVFDLHRAGISFIQFTYAVADVSASFNC